MTSNENKRNNKSRVLVGEILEATRNEQGEYEFSGSSYDQGSVERNIWKSVKKAARQIPFMDDVVAGYYCAIDTRTPNRVRAILLAALGYFVLPLDSIPDFILGFGFSDDVAVLAAAIAAVRSHITDAHYALARKALSDDEMPGQTSGEHDEDNS